MNPCEYTKDIFFVGSGEKEGGTKQKIQLLITDLQTGCERDGSRFGPGAALGRDETVQI